MSKSSRSSPRSHRMSAPRRSSEFSIEELSDDDVGYDADVEVVKPEYEDADSNNEDDTQQDEESSEDSEDHLSHRLRGLYCDPTMMSSDPQTSPKKGRKRMSREMDGGRLAKSVRNGRPDFEILELSVHTDDKHPAKRQRRSLITSKTTAQDPRARSGVYEQYVPKSSTDTSTGASSPGPVEDTALAVPEKQDFEMEG